MSFHHLRIYVQFQVCLMLGMFGDVGCDSLPSYLDDDIARCLVKCSTANKSNCANSVRVFRHSGAARVPSLGNRGIGHRLDVLDVPLRRRRRDLREAQGREGPCPRGSECGDSCSSLVGCVS